ncbi:MAG: stage V sporulation protein AC [Firmicutes bacterium]|jgi:stage V sporulation protein AC|nr:stage V sporulation protein AC [Bacillota bacterium]NLO65829.1 stage V sporulation protein AC [Bacillota bacterium]
MQPEEYQQLVLHNSPRRPLVKNTIMAFLTGGLFCLLGQVFLDIATIIERTEMEAAAVTLAAMILVGTILTGLGVYDEIAEIGGAGAAVPITGFANTVTSAAMEFRREGFLTGMGSKIFIIAGPVIVYGILSGFIVALTKALLTGLL